MIDDDSAEGEAANRPSKFTANKAAPFHGWARIQPGHLFKSLPTLFQDLAEGSSTERHGIVTGFFHTLEKDNPRTFAGFQPWLHGSNPRYFQIQVRTSSRIWNHLAQRHRTHGIRTTKSWRSRFSISQLGSACNIQRPSHSNDGRCTKTRILNPSGPDGFRSSPTASQPVLRFPPCSVRSRL
jgi:hypothetical protein